jgi:hypothetical protein
MSNKWIVAMCVIVVSGIGCNGLNVATSIERNLVIATDINESGDVRSSSLMTTVELMRNQLPLNVSNIPRRLKLWLNENNLTDMGDAQALPFDVGFEESCFLFSPDIRGVEEVSSVYMRLNRQLSVEAFIRILRRDAEKAILEENVEITRMEIVAP